MAKNTQLSDAAVNAEADALGALLNNGYMRIYSGAQPANGNTALGAQVLLAELRFANPAFAAAVAGVLTANALTADNDAKATGAASFIRNFKADGATPVMDGSAGDVTDAPVNAQLNNKNIQQHAQVGVSGYTHTVPKSGAGV